MREIGPHFDLKMRRTHIAGSDLYKAACKKPKLINPDKKRVSYFVDLEFEY
jgi:hypothetical protein